MPGNLPDFKSSVRLIKTEHFKIATVFSGQVSYKQERVVLKKDI